MRRLIFICALDGYHLKFCIFAWCPSLIVGPVPLEQDLVGVLARYVGDDGGAGRQRVGRDDEGVRGGALSLLRERANRDVVFGERG